MNVLLATDSSPDADAAADFLHRLPRPEPWHVHLVTNLFLPHWDADGSDPDLGRYRQQQLTAARENFQRIESVLTLGHGGFEHRIVEGDVGHSIVVAAEEVDADLVVLGAKGHSAIARMLLGSVSDYVATHARCNVLVVRPSTPTKQTEKILQVVLALDDTAPSHQALSEFSRFPWGSNVCGTILSIVPTLQMFRQDLSPVGREQRLQRLNDAKKHATDAVERLTPVAPEFKAAVLEADHIGDEIVIFAANQAADLIMVGDRRRTEMAHLLLGSVSRYVLRHGACSVWVARQWRSPSD